MTDEGLIRSFLAIDPPEEVFRSIATVQDRMKKEIRGDIRWVRPEGIHLTLKFFGDIAENDVTSISAVVEETAAREEQFALAIGGVGVFPDLKRPRVLWLGMTGDVERLLIFQKDLDLALQGIGFLKDERPFRPHLTLGRIRSSQGLLGLAKVLEKGEGYTAGRFLASGIGLFRSELTPRGALYTRLGWFALAGGNGRPGS